MLLFLLSAMILSKAVGMKSKCRLDCGPGFSLYAWEIYSECWSVDEYWNNTCIVNSIFKDVTIRVNSLSNTSPRWSRETRYQVFLPQSRSVKVLISKMSDLSVTLPCCFRSTIAIVIQVLGIIQTSPTLIVKRSLPDESRESQADVWPSVLHEFLVELLVKEIQWVLLPSIGFDMNCASFQEYYGFHLLESARQIYVYDNEPCSFHILIHLSLTLSKTRGSSSTPFVMSPRG